MASDNLLVLIKSKNSFLIAIMIQTWNVMRNMIFKMNLIN